MKKLNFRKVSAMATSFLLAGMTVGVAAAANYPAPFVSGSSADVAIVYGTGSGVSSLDLVQAGNIQTKLQGMLGGTGGTSTVEGGDSYKFEKVSTKFNLGDGITDVVSSSLDDSELPTLLKDDKYLDNDNDEFDFTQKITMGALNLTMFEDNDYAEDEPTIGFEIPSGVNVLTYTLDFSDEPLMTDMPSSDLMIMGKEYYVLSNTSNSLTLLDSASEVILNEGESTTVNGKTASIQFIGDNTVKLTVDGEITNSLSEGQTYKLNDDSYVGIKEILFTSKETGVSKVEFSIGNGKLELTSGQEIEINDDVVPGISATLSTTGDTFEELSITWDADEDVFVTETTEAVMPAFEAVKLSFGGLTYPKEETIEVQQGGDTYAVLEDFPLKDGSADINFLYGTAGAFQGIGKDSDNLLVTTVEDNLVFDSDTDDYFVASWSDGNDAESYLIRASNFVLDGSDNKTDFQYYKDGTWTTTKSSAKAADEFSLGNVELEVSWVNRTVKQVAVKADNANVNFSTLYSEEGMKVYLPYSVNGTVAEGSIDFDSDDGATAGTGHNESSFYLVMKEEDKDENKGVGDWINVTIGWDSSTTPEVEVSAVDTSTADATSTEIGDTDVFRDFTYSALATEILFNKPSSGQKSVKLMYHGEEVEASVFITSPDAVVTPGSGGSLGDVLVMDTEVSSVSSKNLIIVGGSCINSAAATVLGGAHCGASFTSQTGVGSGQFLIQGFDGGYSSGKLALVVAGYDAADTVNAATYLNNNVVDTSKKYIGTSATSATLQTTEA